MTANIDPSIYTDLQGLTKLRGQVREKSPEALREAARQFEALFVQMMLKSMRDAKLGDGLMDNDQSDMYREMYDKQLSMELTRRNGLGLGDMLIKQLGSQTEAEAMAEAAAGDMPALPALSPVSGLPNALHSVRAQQLGAAGLNAPAETGLGAMRDGLPLSSDVPDFGTTDPGTPESFVQAVWPQAQQAARELGVAPEVLVAQAALETGWGRSVIQHADGRSSHNLFGIKATPGWDGRQVAVQTLEYQNGIPVRTRAAFRSYGSFADSFSDYVGFLQGNPRYRQALAQADNPHTFASALQHAGYATDPAYARKISAIVNGDTLQGALARIRQPSELAQLKQPDGLPLS